MIRTEIVYIDGIEYEHVWSDENRRLCRDGQTWDEVYNPPNTGRVYTEGDEIVEDDPSAEEVLAILLGDQDD